MIILLVRERQTTQFPKLTNDPLSEVAYRGWLGLLSHFSFIDTLWPIDATNMCVKVSSGAKLLTKQIFTFHYCIIRLSARTTLLYETFHLEITTASPMGQWAKPDGIHICVIVTHPHRAYPLTYSLRIISSHMGKVSVSQRIIYMQDIFSMTETVLTWINSLGPGVF